MWRGWGNGQKDRTGQHKKKTKPRNSPRLCRAILKMMKVYLSSVYEKDAGTQCLEGLVAWNTDFIVAGAAIDGSVILGQEWHLSFGTALGANHSMHFAGRTLTRASTETARCIASCCAAGRTTTRLIHQPFLLVEFLLACSKDEIVTAIAAFEGFVNEVQLGTSL